MAWSGGTFTGLHFWTNDRDANIKITASRHEAQDDVFIAGINSSINKDGSNAFTATADFGGYGLSEAGTITPKTASASDIGSAALEFGDVYIGDDKDVYYGNDQDYTLGYNTTLAAMTLASAVEGVGFNLVWQADQGDDSKDQWKWQIDVTTGVLLLRNDASSADTFITHVSFTPHATVASSLVNFAGEVQMVTLDIGGTNVTSTAAELNIMDGGTSATSTTLADADRVVVNDGGTMKQVALTDFETYFEIVLDTLLVTDIKIGEDDQTKVDFETANEIHFYADNAHQVKIVDGAIVPATDNDIDLGTSSVEFKDAYFDGTVTADAFSGPITGDLTGTLQTNAQPNITATGTLQSMRADNIFIDGNDISSSSGNVTITPVSGSNITFDGTITLDGGVIAGASSITSTAFVGALTGNASGTAATVTGAAQTAITSLGTLTALQIDNLNLNGNTLSSTAGTDLLITPLSGQQIVLDGTVIIDSGVITGATSISSTAFVGTIDGVLGGNTPAAAEVTTLGVGATLTDGLLHIQSASAGSVTASVHFDELVVEGSGNAGITILAGTSGESGIAFGDSGSSSIGQIVYRHATNDILLRANGAINISLLGSGTVINDFQADIDFRVECNTHTDALFIEDNKITIGSLGGSGSRAVVADANGVLSAP
jgi:hypothetical protein